MNELKNITYNPRLKPLVGNLPSKSAKAENLLWQFLKERKMGGYTFNRQMPIGNYIIDFFSYELLLGIVLEDGKSATEVEEKKNQLAELGLHVFYFNNQEILYKLPEVIVSLEKYISKYEDVHHTPNISGYEQTFIEKYT